MHRRSPLLLFCTTRMQSLLAVPHLQRLHSLHLLLQLQHTVHERLGCRWTSRHVDINGDDAIAATDNRIGVMVVPASVCATAHRNDPPGLRHLIVDFPKRRCHLIRQRTSDNDHIRLAGRRTEDDTVTIHVVARSSDVHHLDGTTGQSEGEWPNGSLPAPVQNIVQTSDSPFGRAGLLRSKGRVATLRQFLFLIDDGQGRVVLFLLDVIFRLGRG